MNTKNIAVIGAGWAGLSAALTLQRQGHHVTMYDRAPASGAAYQGAGGRASTAYTAGEKAPFAIDNGQHVLLGAYRDTLALFESLNINAAQAFLRLPAAWYVPQHLNLALPAWADSTAPRSVWNRGVFKQLPMALAMLKACPPRDWFAVLCAAVRMQGLVPSSTETVAQWLNRLRFPAPFDAQLWLPLCYATLNTPPTTASAAVFARVIQDGLLAGSQAAAMLVPRADLGSLLPATALAALARGGATLKLGTAVSHITALCCEAVGNTDPTTATATARERRTQTSVDGRHVAVCAGGETVYYDAIVCATTAKDALRILPAQCISPALQSLALQAPEPITTIHLNIGRGLGLERGLGLRLPKAVCVLPEPEGSDDPIQHAVAIDRSYLAAAQAGWVTVVLSCSGAALTHSREVLIRAALQRLQTCLPELKLPIGCEGIVIHAKQATFSCTAGLSRPAAQTAAPAIVLAGDYVAGDYVALDYPATLEGAVRSGIAAAHWLCTLARPQA
jgi:hydroxysqualene dehydroxylase